MVKKVKNSKNTNYLIVYISYIVVKKRQGHRNSINSSETVPINNTNFMFCFRSFFNHIFN